MILAEEQAIAISINEYSTYTGIAVEVFYEFEAAYGNTISSSGSLKNEMKFRFSSKYFEAEINAYNYGYRFYSPELGRWVSRDPISEYGGDNIYGFVGNDSVNMLDFLGLEDKGYAYVGFGNPMAWANPKADEVWNAIYDEIKILLQEYDKDAGKKKGNGAIPCCVVKLKKMMKKGDLLPALTNFREIFFFGHAIEARDKSKFWQGLSERERQRYLYNKKNLPKGVDKVEDIMFDVSYKLAFADDYEGTSGIGDLMDQLVNDKNWKNVGKQLVDNDRLSPVGGDNAYDPGTGQPVKPKPPKDREATIDFLMQHFYPYVCYDGKVAAQIKKNNPNITISPPFNSNKPNISMALGMDMKTKLEALIKKDCQKVRIIE